jgi:CRISPR-associated endonuclease Csn1
MPESKENSYVLGLDLGPSSVGWALLDSQHRGFVGAGVRVFDSGMDEIKFAKGEQGASNNVQRRMARLHRRQLRRRAARQRDLFVTLQNAGLLPPEPRSGGSEARHAVLMELDRRLGTLWRERVRAENPAVVAPEHVLPYFLRARALDHFLEPFELGRALYHLGQRRGYKSNRREGRKAAAGDAAPAKKKREGTEEEERKKVLAEIQGLEREIAEKGARTLGEFLSRRDPSITRVRRLHTERKMFQEEFEHIWSAQQRHHPQALTPQLKTTLLRLLFFQRPISAGKPGMCELEKDCPRAPIYTLAAQRFRLLQKANDLAIVLPSGEKQFLTVEQRQQVLDKLENEGDLTFPRLRTLLGLPKTARFNLELNDETRLKGNRTNAALRKAFGERWQQFADAERKHFVRLWAEQEDKGELYQLALGEWGLDAEAARALAETEPEDGYSKLSLRAFSRLLPLMETGKPFKTAETELYGDRFSGKETKPLLPPVEKVLPQIPNPAVMRALTEMRKVVNAILREHGKPAQVRVELARDLKRSAKDRQRLMDAMEDQRMRRAKVVKRIEQEAGIPNPSGPDIERGLLFEELSECAYCGNSISFANLFSDARLFDVDHILPHSRFPDNSFANKTLACSTCNALKINRTPFEAFGANAEMWEKLQVRIGQKHKGNRFALGADKRRRFLLEKPEEVEAFSARHLADTRYITKMAARYLEELYGGRDKDVPWEDQRRRCVFASSGTVTATLRKAWGLESLLPRCESCARKRQKCRCDHRHHAVDALVITLSNDAAIRQLSAAAAAGDGRISGRVSSRTLQAPWADFVESLKPAIDGLMVSHRPNHRLPGGMHDETNYSSPKPHNGKQFAHVRKPVHLLTAKQIASGDVIVDKAARLAIQGKLAEVGDPKKLEGDPPCLTTRTGKRVPIRRVRIRTSAAVRPLGKGARERYVALRDNHHIALFSGPDKRGRPAWHGIVVSRLEAMERKRNCQQLIENELPGHERYEFLFSLMGGDMVEMKHPSPQGRQLFVVRTISEAANGRIELDFVRHNDARLVADMKASSDWIRIMRLNDLRELGCRKVMVDALGRVRSANG